MRLFLCGDVMTGRGVDQIMPRHCAPTLYEPYMHSALGYVTLAERRSGPIPRAVAAGYIWGEALGEIDSRKPDVRIINLETSITADGDPEPKGINYRMHPDNTGCLVAARIDCCALANNHIADWGLGGLTDTIDALEKAGIAIAGVGRDSGSAARPAILPSATGDRLLVFAYGSPSSGIPQSWASGPARPGVNWLANFGEEELARVADDVAAWRKPGDIILVSIHWDRNWSYDIPEKYRKFAHGLIERAGADIIHGHSSHHPKAIEVHEGKPIFYGCGDFINDYEGIRGNEEFHPDLALGYFVDIDDRDPLLQAIDMVPFRLARFRLEYPPDAEVDWLADTMDRECGRFGHHVRRNEDDTLSLSW